MNDAANLQIGNVKVDIRLALAPMAGVTDLPFRKICREMGAGLTYTEMVSAKALVYQDGKTKGLSALDRDEHPAAVQIFGSDPECMAEGTLKVLEISGADFIDINMGCPVGKVVKSGDGCALMKNPVLAGKIITAVVKAAETVNRPVTVKIRKGWDKGSVNAVEFAKMAQDAGACAVAVHGRTRAQMYSGKADWNIIRDVKNALNVPVIANGDIISAQDAVHIFEYTGADVAMIARGAMGNPWIFREADALMKNKPVPPSPTVEERADTAMRQIELTAAVKGERIACLEARRHYVWYLRGIPYAGFFKKQIAKAESIKDYKEITESVKRELSLCEQ